MTTDSTQVQVEQSKTEQKSNDKEFNFRQLEAKYRAELERERNARIELENRVQKLSQQNIPASQDDDEDAEPYVNHKGLNKKLSSFEQRMEEKIDKRAEDKARNLIEDVKKNAWLEANPDFYDTLQHAEKFAQTNPVLADTILKMPDGFERQKLVYANIKALGIDKPEQKQVSIQEKIDANRRSPYYQPSGIANAPYSSVGDYSEQGKKQSYEKMQELKKRLRLG
jgi:hypothetical protein